MMRRGTSKADFELIRLVAVGAAMMMVTVLVIGRSTAAFSDEAAGSANGGIGSGSSGAGTGGEPAGDPDPSGSVPTEERDRPADQRPPIKLTDNDSGRAVMDLRAMVPGQQAIRCVQVSYDGSTPAGPVHVYSPTGALGSGLGAYLDLTIESGTWAGSTSAYPSCDGFEPLEVLLDSAPLDEILSEHESYETGIIGWTPEQTDSRVFRFTFELLDDNAAQGLDVRFDLVWEARSRR